MSEITKNLLANGSADFTVDAQLALAKQTEQSKLHWENQVKKACSYLTDKFFADCEAVRQSTMSQQNSLLWEIRENQKALATTRTVNSMGGELKERFGPF